MVHAVSAKRSFRRRVGASLAASLLVLVLGSCAEREAYETALETNSIPAFRDYVQTYPDGEFADEAYDRMEELYFEHCLAKATPDGARSSSAIFERDLRA